MNELTEIGKRAKEASKQLAHLNTDQKNQVLLLAAELLERSIPDLLEANAADLKQGEDMGLKGAIVERLSLTDDRIRGIAEGLREIVQLEDPIGEIEEMKKRPNGLLIGKKRVPLGVVGVIYESRPNVTADVAGLCIKTGNVCVLRGGKEAFHSNNALVKIFHKAIFECGLDPHMVQLVQDTSRESAIAMMKLNAYLDILIPRGGAGLIQAVVQNSTVPVIETGVGNCHIYVDEAADLEKAVAIVYNAKTHRPGVCNAAESLLIHKKVAVEVLPDIGKALKEGKVEIRGDRWTCELVPDATSATEEDWSTEYLDLIISSKVVGSVEEAVDHINRYGSMHSESIITENYSHAQYFLDRVDAAAVYVNASTRFTDGFEFGYGAEIGISTQKLHARGPMGLKELTTSKYIIYGSGQTR
ncbi:MAG: glutamate-5-semialdehyde dehydrogenase [Bacteroidetes bacterium]|nr:MAG: glutamate-5-semialdehyde dehydrogenase [Bacteroidota bacterium]RLE02813.1 MAG: glutamate-5-semialdehyde dehydrogenase [Bacteroidota bacterium]